MLWCLMKAVNAFCKKKKYISKHIPKFAKFYHNSWDISIYLRWKSPWSSYLICKKPGLMWPGAPSQLLESMDCDPESSSSLVPLHALNVSGLLSIGCFTYLCQVALINHQIIYFKDSIVFLPLCDSCIIAHWKLLYGTLYVRTHPINNASAPWPALLFLLKS